MASGVTLRFGFAEVGCVAVAAKNHIALGIGEDGVRMGCNIVEEMLSILHGVLGGGGLGRGKGAECDKDGCIAARQW